MKFSLPPQDIPLVDIATGLINIDWYDKLKQAEVIISGSSKLVAFSRVLSVASGNQSVAGVGFQPRLIFWQTAIAGGGSNCSQGTSDGASSMCLEMQSSGAANQVQNNGIAGLQRDNVSPGANYGYFSLASFDADGFTIAWIKAGAPTLTASCIALCFR